MMKNGKVLWNDLYLVFLSMDVGLLSEYSLSYRLSQLPDLTYNSLWTKKTFLTTVIDSELSQKTL